MTSWDKATGKWEDQVMTWDTIGDGPSPSPPIQPRSIWVFFGIGSLAVLLGLAWMFAH